MDKKLASLFLKKEISSNTLKMITKLKNIREIIMNLFKKFLMRNFSYVLNIFSFVIKN